VPGQTRTKLGELDSLVVETTVAPKSGGSLIVVLHGWGGSASDLASLVRPLARRGARVILPDGHQPHPAAGRAWWALDLEKRRLVAASGRELDLSGEVPDGLAEARGKVLALVAEACRRYQPKTLALVGFSQGAMLALDVALFAEPPVDAVVVLAGTLLAERVWRERMLLAQTNRPRVFIAHGREDPILPITMSLRLRDLLTDHGFLVRWKSFEGGHLVPQAVLDELGMFLRDAERAAEPRARCPASAPGIQ